MSIFTIWNDAIKKLILIVCSLSCSGLSTVFACRYNVRDVGFIDLGDQPYGFFCYVDDNTEQYLIEGFRDVTDAELHQTNIEAVMVNVNTSPDHPLLPFLDSDTKTLPAFVLVSPARQTMKIESIVKGGDYKKSLRDSLNNIFLSPFRKEIADKVVDTFGLILIIEGLDAEEYENATTTAQTTIDHITSQMKWLPKKVGNPPVILKMSRQQQQKEKILLWSLGIDPDNISQTYAVVLYGRGRLMGRTLSDEYLTKEMLARFFYMIGADCECGLDRSLMQGNMMPARWGNEQLQKLYEQLGFDTENPMVKFEVSRIIRRGSLLNNGAFNPNENLDYLEYQFKLDIPESKQDIVNVSASSNQVVQNSPNNDIKRQKSVEQSEVNEKEFRLWNPLYIIGIAGIIVFGFSAFILISISGRKR